MKKPPLHIAIFIGMALGAVVGRFFPECLPFVNPVGAIFLKLLRLLVIPLIFVSLVDGIARVGSMEKLSRLGLRTVLYYLMTTGLAVMTGLILVNWIQPGKGVKIFGEASPAAGKNIEFLNFIPDNFFAALAKGDTLQIIFVALLVGIVSLGSKVDGIRKAVGELNELMLKLTSFVIALAPIGVFALMAKMAATLDLTAFMGIAKFALTNILGLLIHGGITLTILFKLMSKRPFLPYLKHSQPALITAFSTSSSSATLPVTMECVEKRAGISKETAGFVLPIGATINMDGTAIYEAAACLFIAQATGVDLTLGQQVIVFITASVAAMGAGAIPSAGLVTLAMVLSAVNLPLEGIGFLLAFDRPLDMSRTILNVWGDMVACAILDEKK